MKFRLLSASFLSACGIFALPLSAQDASPAATSNPPTEVPQPLQLQDNPVPATSNAPAQPHATAVDPAPVDPPASTNAPAPADTNAVIPPAPGEPAAPTPDSGMGSPGQNPPPSDPNSLIPPAAEPEQPSPINAAGNEERQRQEQKARYYAVKVKADKDQDLVSLQDKAATAKNEEAKRQALRQYYDLLAKRMKKIDSSLSEWIDTMHSAYLRRIAQDRLEPTIPLNVPPVPDASASPSPSPKQSADSAEPTPTPKKKRHKAPVND